MHRCTGYDNGDCDNCCTRYCREWIECDECGEEINSDEYYRVDGNDYCIDCFERNHEFRNNSFDYLKCDECGDDIYDFEDYFMINNEHYCADCAEKNYKFINV